MSNTKIKNNLVVTGGTITVGGQTVSTQAGSETLTNKTIDASLNTISNISNAEIKAAANIALSKLAALTAAKALVSDGSGVISASSVTATELGYVSGVTSAIQTQLDAKIPLTQKGAANGVATLDAGGKIPASQLPNSVMELQGFWDASTNTPTLADGSGNPGDVYEVSVAGTQNLGSGSITFKVGDWAVYAADGKWHKSINSNEVTSVNGQTGTVTVNAINQLTGDITTSAASGSQSLSATIAAGAVTATKLGTVTDGITLDQSGTGSTLEVKAGGISNSHINASAAIALSKLAALSNSIVPVTNGSGVLTSSSVTATELGYVSGVTSAIQTQLNNKQPLDSTLTALAAFNSNGLMVQTNADTFTARTLTAGSIKVSVTNGDGVSGNPTVDVTESNLTLNNIGGTLGISKGGTGATTAQAAIDALSPLTTKGDILVHNGTNNIRLPAGTNGYALVADSSQASGLKYAAVATNVTGDITETSFSMANNQVSAANVTGLAFANASVRSFKALVSVKIDATSNLYEVFELLGIQKGSSWDMAVQSTGDDSQVSFSITNAGQIQYTSGNITGFTAGVMHFRAIVTSV